MRYDREMRESQATGSQGGRAGTGKAKVRGGSEHYRALAMKRRQCGRELPEGTRCVRLVAHAGECSAEPRTLPAIPATTRYYVDPVR